ncbi:PhzF family phenazine biosynthesis isomerase [Streptomyces sp. NPDC050095]|uniref:PhzF family phenazine biosynthesis protein n=1 Tax=unclassified Streptomyces TaxID=2593676 RepID=UPI003431AA25
MSTLVPVTVVDACLRAGRGGSPTAVVDDTGLADAERRRVPVLLGTSHAVFLRADDARDEVGVRFFTATGELPACGHGTVAALAVLAGRACATEYRTVLRTRTHAFAGRATRTALGIDASFETAAVRVREPVARERRLLPSALGLAADVLAPGMCVAALGRERVLVPVVSRAALDAVAPDAGRLREVCDRLGLLGAYVHTMPDADGRAAARMFAPSIGVPEDVANANSTACLAARLGPLGVRDIAVDMGDGLGRPATLTAGVRSSAAGPLTHVGGAARVDRVVALDLS